MLCLILHLTDTDSFPKPLNAKEENELLIKFANGDKRAREKLIEHNLRLVAHIVKKYENFVKKGLAKKKTNDTIDKYQKMSKTSLFYLICISVSCIIVYYVNSNLAERG